MIKQIICCLLTCCVFFDLAAAEGVTINGLWNREAKVAPASIQLYQIHGGRIKEIASTNLSVEGKFGFIFHPETENYYVIGVGRADNPADKYRFYFKVNDELNIIVNDSSYQLIGKVSAENNVLEKWHQYTYDLQAMAIYFNRNKSTFREFFPSLENVYQKEMDRKWSSTGNGPFDASFAVLRKYELMFYAMEMVCTPAPRREYPTRDDYSPFYANLNTEHYTATTQLMKEPWGNRTLTNLRRFVLLKRGEQGFYDTKDPLAGFLNDTIRGEIVLALANGLKSAVGYRDLYKHYGQYIVSGEQKERARNISTKLSVEERRPRAKGKDFTHPDIDGKMISLSHFKGKLVLLDVWATWCGPCKTEIPFLRKMEEDYKGRDIVFISVAVDDEKDVQKWKDFVVNEALTGVQLFGSKKTDIKDNYNLTTIPRFILFDREGNVVALDAPRPSTRELRLLVDRELGKEG